MMQIKGYTDYLITEDGQVFSTKRKRYLKPMSNAEGYLQISLCKEGVYKSARIHRLVAEAFIPNPENKKTINHKNGIRTDNRIENLEWNTYSENNLHSYRVLGKKAAFFNKYGWDNPRSKAVVCSNGSVYGSIREAARVLGLCNVSIMNVCKGKSSQISGYKFKYA